MSEGVPSDDGPLPPDKEREGLAPGEGALPNLVVIGAMKCGASVCTCCSINIRTSPCRKEGD